MSDRDADPLPFTRQGLLHRAGNYFEQVRTPREEWKTLEDLAPQLTEFELRCQGEDYDTAATVLLAIDLEYLITWGHYRLTVELHHRLRGRLADPWTIAASATRLGECLYRVGDLPAAIQLYEQALTINRDIDNRRGQAIALSGLGYVYAHLGQTTRAIDLFEQTLTINRDIDSWRGQAIAVSGLGYVYADLGQTTRAIDLFEQALTINQDVGNRQGDATARANLGYVYADLGQTTRAIDLFEQALTIYRDIGNRSNEANLLGNLGKCYADLGQTTRAIDLFEQALTINRDIGNRRGEGSALRGLGSIYADLGQTTRAIDLFEQALTINRDIDWRKGESSTLNSLGDAYADLERRQQSIEHLHQAVLIADGFGFRRVQSAARVSLAKEWLFFGDVTEAQRTIDAARDHPFPPQQATVALVAGIIALHRRSPAAADTFQEALAESSKILTSKPENYGALDTSALAHCGLAITSDPVHATEAAAAFNAARALTAAPGITKRVLRLFDALADADPEQTLHGLRAAASGSTHRAPM